MQSTFSDEFADAALDTAKWVYKMGADSTSQVYYTDSTDNCFIEDGQLVIRAIKQVETSNLLSDNQATGGDTSGDTTGFATSGTGVSISRDTTLYQAGTGSIKVVTPGSGNGEGLLVSVSSADFTVGKSYTFSAYVYGSGNLRLWVGNQAWATRGQTAFAAAAAFTKYTVVFTPKTGDTTLYLTIVTNGAQALTFYADTLKFSQGEYDAGKLWTSARIHTLGNFTQQYGRFEARIKVPAGQGAWPAFWMEGADLETLGWPDCGEIDIMENIGAAEPDIIWSTLHGPAEYSTPSGKFPASYKLPSGNLADGFHVYRVDWTKSWFKFSIDGIPYSTVTREQLADADNWVFDKPFFIILNLAVGGDWAGDSDSTTPTPLDMLVDYVRAYQPVQAAVSRSQTNTRLQSATLTRAANGNLEVQLELES